MPDQAEILRSIARRGALATHVGPDLRSSCGPRAATIAVTSGKGGVGKSNIALNLGVALARLGARVCLLDANLGLGNLDLLCGLNGYWNLSHVLSGARTLEQVALRGPEGVTLIPGASGIVDAADFAESAQSEILAQLDEIERGHDVLVIDTGTGIHRAVRQFVAAADLAIVVTTPEPTAIADAYATIKALSGCSAELRPLVNQVESNEQAERILERIQQTARMFLHRPVSSAGQVPRDPAVPAAVARRTPFVLGDPASPASEAIERIARRIRGRVHRREDSYFPQVWQKRNGVI